MSTSELTADEMFDSLTGFDEIAIAKAFDLEITGLAQHKPTLFLRALVFVDRRRAGADDKTAKQASLELPLGQVHDYFVEDPEDPDPEDPDSEVGKDGSAPPDEQNCEPSSSS